MSTPDFTPRFARTDATRIARELFGIDCTASALPSERDQNFALESAAGEKLVLKIAKSDEDPLVLDFQNAALRHLHQRVRSVALPQIVPTRSGEEIAAITDAAGRTYRVRLVSWLRGELLSSIVVRDSKLLASLGRAIAVVDEALKDFSHPLMHRALHWDLRHIDLALRHLPLLSAERRAMVEELRRQWQAVSWQELPGSVIHGDINDNNVLVRNGRVSGFIDFGDMVHSARICDLAIAIAYAMLDQGDPMAVAVSTTAAYNELCALRDVEIDAVFALVTCRLCMSVCYSAYNAVAKSADAYQRVHEESAWKLLKRLSEIPEQQA